MEDGARKPQPKTRPDVPATADANAPARSVRVRTDVLDLVIDLNGGDLVLS